MDRSSRIPHLPSNSSDMYAAAVLKDIVIFGHLPRELLQILLLFVLRNATYH